jgi:hypothetical protein
MITIATAAILSLSLLLSAFLGFSPQIHKLVENDLMRRAYNNNFLYGLQLGQLGVRAKSLTTDSSTAKPLDLPFRLNYANNSSQATVQDRFTGEVKLQQDTSGNLNINAQLTHKFQ